MKVVHVDDHPMFSESMSNLLTSNDPSKTVVNLASGREALDFLDEQGGDIDLILMDLDMPGITGFELLEAIRQRNLLIPVIVISGSEDLWEIRHVMNAGASGFVPKAFQPRQFFEILETVMDGGIYIPDDIRVSIAQLPDSKPDNKRDALLAEYNLSLKQYEVLKLMQKGHKNDEIGQILHLSVNTIKTHVRTLFIAFDVNDRLKCVLQARKVGLLNWD